MTERQLTESFVIEDVRLLLIEFAVNETFDPTGEVPDLHLDLRVQRSFAPPKEAVVVVSCAAFVDQSNRPFSFRVMYQARLAVPEGGDWKALHEFSRTGAPAALIPYIREAIASATVRAGFPPLILPPMDVTTLIEDAEEGPSIIEPEGDKHDAPGAGLV
jgi:preprotein translocase subunit SecB